jgi:type II secretory pathway pseudopilin PulG
MAIMAIVGVLAAILLPALASARERSHGIYCLNNTRQLTLAWQLYADDHGGLLPYNQAMAGTVLRTNANWVNNVMTWDLSSDNTNLQTITSAALGLYVASVTGIFHDPSDHALSGAQMAAGWSQRIRSYSMNAMVGDPGRALNNGQNVNNPGFRQFLKSEQMPRPGEIFIFLDEHPDSISDGSFLDRDAPAINYSLSSAPNNQWGHLPASYHNRCGGFSFGDGHAALHHWSRSSTAVPAVPYAASFPMPISASPVAESADFEWVVEHMSVEN